jgi:lipopolysaccharide export system permease protein
LQAQSPEGNNKVSRPWITVLDKMIVLDLLKTLLSVWSVVVAIIVSRAFIRILDKAVDGQLSNETLLTLLAFKTIIISIDLLSAAVFMAVLMVIGRMYKDQEMAAVASAGGGSGAIYRAVFMLLLPVSVITIGLSLVVSPWAEAGMESLMDKDKQTADLRGIAAGKFSEYSHGDLVFYVEQIDASKKMHKVFVQQRSVKGLLGIITAETGRLVDLPDGQYMVFEHGERVQGKPGTLNYVVEAFDEYFVLIEEKTSSARTPRLAVASGDLWHSNALVDTAELQRRCLVPFSILVLAFLAVPLAQISPRGGVYGNIVMGFLIYFAFGNFSRVSQAWVTKGTISAVLGAVGVNGLFLLVGAVLLARLYGWQWLFMKIGDKARL